MKRLLLSLILLLTTLCVHSQSMSVASFERNERDFDAKLIETKKIDGRTGLTSAIVKFETTIKGFDFTPSMAGIVDIDYSHTAEIWLYLPKGSMYITIAHEDYGRLRVDFDETLAEGAVYRLKLDTEERVISNKLGRLSILTSPNNMTFTIGKDDPIEITNGEDQLRLPHGEYRYTASAPNHHPTEGEFTVHEESTELRVSLVSHISKVSATCPTADAKIYLDNRYVGIGSWSGELLPGEYELRAEKDKHRASTERVTIEPTTTRAITLSAPEPIYGSLRVSAEQTGVEVSVDGVSRGSAPVTIGNLLIGEHSITLSKSEYVSTSAKVEISDGQTTEYRQSALMSVKDSEEYKLTAWQRESITYILPQVGYDVINGTLSYGVMVGWSKRFGGYVKYMSSFKSAQSSGLECDNNGTLNSDTTEPNYKDSSASLYIASAGVMHRIKPWLSVYGGGGVGSRVVEYELLSGDYAKNTDISIDMSYSLDVGVLMRFGGFSLSVGVSNLELKYSQLNLGVGVNF